jgi:hypothetical protein
MEDWYVLTTNRRIVLMRKLILSAMLACTALASPALAAASEPDPAVFLSIDPSDALAVEQNYVVGACATKSATAVATSLMLDRNLVNTHVYSFGYSSDLRDVSVIRLFST